jgi:integrase
MAANERPVQLRHAVGSDRSAGQPHETVKIPGATKRQEESRVLTVEEFHKLLAQIEGEPYRTMVVLAMCLGLRCSELIGRQWQDLDWENLALLRPAGSSRITCGSSQNEARLQAPGSGQW